MSIQRLLAALLALAVLLGPLAVQSGIVMAMAPTGDEHAQLVSGNHCNGQSEKQSESNPADKSCCTAMCLALAVVPIAAIEPYVALGSEAKRPSLAQDHRGFLARLPTPPPRSA